MTVIPYWQIPVQLKVALWKPTKIFSLWSTIESAIGLKEDGIQVSRSGVITSVLYSSNKIPKTLFINNTITSKPVFITGAIGISGKLALSKRINTCLSIRRFCSKKDLVTLDTVIKDDLSKEDKVNGRVGQNALTYSAGLSI